MTQRIPEKIEEKRKHGLKYWRTLWKQAVEAFYGDAGAAEKWFTTPNSNLCAVPADLLENAPGRQRLSQEIKGMEQEKSRLKPQTAWRTCRAFYPSRFNGELLFRNTEIPACALFQHLQGGGSTQEFLEQNPGITAEQVSIVFDPIILDLCDF